jgi:hypothetical protein
MSGVLHTLTLAVLAFLFFSLVASAVLAFASGGLLAAAQRRTPDARARFLASMLAAPAWVGLLLTAACFLPGLAARYGIGEDHCLHHNDEHLHFCFTHLARLHGVAPWLVLAVATLVAAVVAARLTRDVARGWRLARSLAALSGPDQDGVHIVDSSVPFAWSIGLFRPRLFVSARLAHALAPTLFKVVLDHERAHGHRRDVLARLLLTVLSLPHLPAVRKQLLDAHALACEEACDAIAATTSDPVTAASAIVAVERLMPAAWDSIVVASFSGDVEARVGALLSPRTAGRRSRRGWPIALLVATVVIVGADPLHHLTETLLGLLAG